MIGQNDFIEYWSAFRIFLQNADLYDPALMAAVQQEQGFAATPPLMMWLPPWALVLLYPFLYWNFETSSQLWLATNVFLLVLSTKLLCQTFEAPKNSRIYLYLASLMFVPSLSCIELGQVSILLLFGVSLFIWSIKFQRDLLAGCSLVLLTLKPHLFLPLGIVVLYWIFKTSRFRVLTGAACAFVALLFLVFLLSPAALEFWISSLTEIRPGAPSKISWITPTIVGMTRLLLAEGKVIPNWPLILFPGILAIVTLLACIRYRLSESLIPLTPLILAVSFCFSPFGWIFDAVVLLPCVIQALLYLKNKNELPGLFALLVIFAVSQMVVLYVHGSYFGSHHSFFWFPLLILVLEIVRLRLAVKES